MAWTHPTAEGYMFGSPSKLRVMLFEICRAIYQRDVIANQFSNTPTTTFFLKADGTPTLTPSMADLYHMPLWGQGSENIMRQNMSTIQTWVKTWSNSTRYYKTGAFDATLWTLSDLQTEIGYTFPTSYPEKLTDAAWWQAVIDSLDLLKVMAVQPFSLVSNLNPYVTSRTWNFQATPTPYPSHEDDAWDDMVAETPADDSGLYGLSVVWSCGKNLFTPDFRAAAIHKATQEYILDTLPGTPTSINARLDSGITTSGSGAYTGDPWTVRITTTQQHDVEMELDETLDYEIPLGEFEFGEDGGSISIERLSPALPAAPPFNSYMLSAIVGYGVRLDGLRIHLDLSSELDDQ